MPPKPKANEAVAEPADKDQPQMLGLLRRVLLAAVGAAVIAQEEIEAFVNRLVDRGEIAQKDAKKLVREMRPRRKKQTARAEYELNKNVESALKRMNVLSKADVESLNQKIDTLSKKVDELKKT